MKSVEGMIACVAITGAVLFTPAQKLLKHAEAQVCARTQLAFNMELPPLPPVAAMYLPETPLTPHVRPDACPGRQLEIAKLTADHARMQSEIIRHRAEMQARIIAQQRVKAALAQATWRTGQRGD